MVEEHRSLDGRHSEQGYISGIPKTWANRQDDKGQSGRSLRLVRVKGFRV